LNRDVHRLLREVAAQAHLYGATALRPPCDEQRLSVLRLRVGEELGIAVPAELEEFLLVADGMNWNGLYLYPSATTSLAGQPDVVLAGLVESNLDHRDTGGPEDVLVFGHDSLDLFAWRSSTGEFQVLDLVPRDVLETLPSFDALMGVALGRCLNS
jgi:hypothetical protein